MNSSDFSATLSVAKTAPSAFVIPAAASRPAAASWQEYPWEASLDASLARLHVALDQLTRARAPPPSPGLAGAASPLQYLNDIMSMQMLL